MTLMDRHEVGIVLVQELSRLSRKRSDIASFLEFAEEISTLIHTNGALHDPGSDDLAAALGLEMAGAFGNYDNRVRTRRMRDAKLAKAKRGQAVSPPPVGYVRAPGGAWIKDPDRATQDAIQRVFDLYPKLGSLGKIVEYFKQKHLEFPRRAKGQVRWGLPSVGLLHSVLRNPSYCGDYVCLRWQSKKRADGAGVTVKRRAPNEGIVTSDHHDPYVPREAWQRIQDLLASHRPAMRPLIGKGDAVVQGLLRCGAEGCNRWMNTHYWGREGLARTATYTCVREDGSHKVTFPARLVDHAIAEHVLAALTELDHETARGVIERSQLERAALERAQRRRLLDAEDDVQRLRQSVRALPHNLQHARLDLMQEYDAAVERHLALKTELATAAVPAVSVSTADVGDLIQLSRTVRQLWAAPQRTHQERKDLLQTVLSEVILLCASPEAADLEVVWKGGSRQAVPVLRAPGVEATVRDLTLAGKDAQSIADALNAAGTISASGRPISKNLVHQKQGHLGLRLKEERRVAREIIRDGLLDHHRPRPEILRQLNEQAPRLGPWEPQRLSDEIRRLRKGISAPKMLPTVLPAEREKQQILQVIEDSLRVYENWKTIAIKLNASGLRPPRGHGFTPVQCRLLYMRAHGLSSFKLPPAAPKQGAPEG